jgi:large repetitive protein
LAIGNQKIEVTDDITGCVATATILVSEPSALTLALASNTNANCNFGAQVSVSASGGTPNYTYAFVQDTVIPVASDYANSSSAIIDPTLNTQWDVYVKDSKGCSAKIDVTIATDALPTITVPALQCFTGSPLSITISGSGVGALTYSIGGAYQSSPTFAITTPGSYTLSIKDGNGCTASTLYLVQPQLALDVVLTKDLDCTASPNAVISLSANGGTAVYTSYEYSTNAGASYSLMASNVLTTATAGTYSFRVTDSQNCQALSTDVVVTAQTSPAFTFVQTNVSCHGSSDGTVVVSASNGIAPYQYSIDNGVSFQSSNVFTGLNPAGTYWLIVKDNKSCDSSPTAVTITEPTTVTGTAVLTQGLSCGSGNASQPALVTVTGNGGTGMYQYSFDGGLHYTATATYTTNVAGTVTAYIKDANGCISPIPATVNVPGLNPPTDLNFVSTAVSCLALTSDVTLTATNGTSALSYAILSPATATANLTGATTGIFLGLAPDTYLFEVTDANSCTYQEAYTVAPVTNITVSGLLTSDVSCAGGSDGSVEFTVSNFAGTYSYSIN